MEIISKEYKKWIYDYIKQNNVAILCKGEPFIRNYYGEVSSKQLILENQIERETDRTEATALGFSDRLLTDAVCDDDLLLLFNHGTALFILYDAKNAFKLFKEAKYKKGEVLIIKTATNRITVLLDAFKGYGELSFMAAIDNRGSFYRNGIILNFKGLDVKKGNNTERARLYSRMKAEGLRWNSKTMEVETVSLQENAQTPAYADTSKNASTLWKPKKY